MFLDLFRKADKSLDVAGRWIAFILFLAASFTWLAKQMSWAGNLNWADAVFIGVGVALLISLIMSAALVAWRFFNPLPALPEPELDHNPKLEETNSEIKTVKIKIEKLEAEITSHQDNMLKLANETDKKTTDGLEKYDEIFDNLVRKTITRLAEIEKQSSDLQRFVDGLALKYGESDNDIKSVRHGAANLEKEIRQDSEQFRGALLAIYRREVSKMFAANILECHDKLFGPLQDGGKVIGDDWKDWKRTHQEWRRYLDRWMGQAAYFASDVKEKILQTPDEKYEYEWKVLDEQLPNAEAVRKFKQFRIQHTQWEDQRDRVEAKMVGVAFTGMQKMEVPSDEKS